MSRFDVELKKDFIDEAIMNLEEVESSFMELENSTNPKPLLVKIFRLAHNLKGGSRAVGFGEFAEFTHVLESLVLKIQLDEIPLSSEVVSLLLRCNDKLIEMLKVLKEDLDSKFDNTDIIEEIQSWLNGTKVASPNDENNTKIEASIKFTSEITKIIIPKTESEAPPIVLEKPLPLNEIPKESKTQQILPTKEFTKENYKESTKEPKGVDDEVIRVNLSKVSKLNDFVGELIVLQSVVQQQIPKEDIKINGSLRQMINLTKEIQNLSMSFRMLSAKPLIQKLQRIVRDTSQTLGKKANFLINGDDIEIDKSVIDLLADPLIHIIRNALDHGLESPEERIKIGKKESGDILLSLYNEGNFLIIEIKDDGKGINSKIIREKAIEKKVINQETTYTESQLINLIFHPGFSTKSTASEVSGRGVGMDVVKTNIEKIGGTVDVTTEVGKGSKFRLQIPLSLAVIEGLVVTTTKNRYVLPLNQVQETINLNISKLHKNKLGIGDCLELRGVVIPIFNLDELLNGKKTKDSAPGIGLIVNVDSQLIAIEVVDIIRAQQIVIKPFNNGLIPHKGWVGTCILGDGLPSIIFNPIELLEGLVTHKTTENKLEKAV